MKTSVFLKSTTVLLLLAIAFLLAPPFEQTADAGWWACAKATAKCVAATGTAASACAAAAAAQTNAWLWTLCGIKVIAAADACDKAARECGL